MPPPGPPCPATPPSQPLHPEEATRALRRPRGARPPPSPLAWSSPAPPPMAMPLTHPRPRPALRPTILNLPCWCARKRGLTDSRLTGRCGRELPPGQVRAAVTPQTHDFSSKRSICVSSPARVCAPRFARARNASLQTPQKPGRPRSPVSLSVPQSSPPASHARLIGPVFPPHFRFPRETAKLTLRSIRDLAPQHRRQFGSNETLQKFFTGLDVSYADAGHLPFQNFRCGCQEAHSNTGSPEPSDPSPPSKGQWLPRCPLQPLPCLPL